MNIKDKNNPRISRRQAFQALWDFQIDNSYKCIILSKTCYNNNNK